MMEKVQEMVGSMNLPVFAEMEKVQEMVGSMNPPAIDKMQNALAGIDASAVSGLSQAVLGIDNSIIEAVGTWAEGIEFGALDAVSSAAASLDLSRFSGIEGTLRSMELSVLQEFASAAAGIDYTRIVELPQVVPAGVDFSVLGGLSTSATGIDSIFEGLAAASAASIDSAFAEIIGSSLSGIETVLGQVGSAYDGIASLIEELAEWDAADQSSEGADSRGALTAPPDLLEVAVFITLVVVLGCYVLPAAIAAGTTATVSSARALGLGLELIDAVYERNAAVRGALYLVGGIGGPLGILAYLDGRSRR